MPTLELKSGHWFQNRKIQIYVTSSSERGKKGVLNKMKKTVTLKKRKLKDDVRRWGVTAEDTEVEIGQRNVKSRKKKTNPQKVRTQNVRIKN